MRTVEKVKRGGFQSNASAKRAFYSYKCLEMPAVITVHFEHWKDDYQCCKINNPISVKGY